MKLSVFVVTYNHEKFIKQCLDSILSQNIDFDYEVIIGDDNSSDSTRLICEEYAKRFHNIRLLPQTANMGVAANWNRVIDACSGDYIAMCEGDDYWCDSNKLQKQIKILDEQPEYSGCYHNADSTDENGNIIQKQITGTSHSYITFADSIQSWYVPTASLVFRNTDYVRKGISDLYKYSGVSTDRLLIALIAHTGNIKFINETMSCYRRHPNAVTKSNNMEQILLSTRDLFKKMQDYFERSYKSNFRWAIQKWNGFLCKYHIENHNILKFIILGGG